MFTDVPKKTSVISCKIHLTTDVPVRSHPYPVPQVMKEVVKSEIDDLLKLGFIERSDSAYGHPIVLVKKSDGSNRFCIDFRKLNKVTIFDPEPIPNPRDLFASMSESRFFLR